MNKSLAKEFLFDLDDIFKKYNITYWLDCGTLLSAVREKDFMNHDDDIDVGMYLSLVENYPLWYKILKDFNKRGIRVLTAWGDSVFSLEKNKAMTGDVHTYKHKDKEYCIEMKDVLFAYPEELFNILDTIEFLGRKFNVPHNPEKWLALMYGDNWKEPHPEIKGWTSKITRPFKHYKLMSYSRNIPLFKDKNE